MISVMLFPSHEMEFSTLLDLGLSRDAMEKAFQNQ